VASGYGCKPDRSAIRPIIPLPLRGRVGERGIKQKNTVIYPLILPFSRREKEPFGIALAHSLLNGIFLQGDPPPAGGGLEIPYRWL